MAILYRSRAEILDGTWTFSHAQAAPQLSPRTIVHDRRTPGGSPG
jgi:hypothetical protein